MGSQSSQGQSGQLLLALAGFRVEGALAQFVIEMDKGMGRELLLHVRNMQLRCLLERFGPPTEQFPFVRLEEKPEMKPEMGHSIEVTCSGEMICGGAKLRFDVAPNILYLSDADIDWILLPPNGRVQIRPRHWGAPRITRSNDLRSYADAIAASGLLQRAFGNGTKVQVPNEPSMFSLAFVECTDPYKEMGMNPSEWFKEAGEQ